MLRNNKRDKVRDGYVENNNQRVNDVVVCLLRGEKDFWFGWIKNKLYTRVMGVCVRVCMCVCVHVCVRVLRLFVRVWDVRTCAVSVVCLYGLCVCV